MVYGHPTMRIHPYQWIDNSTWVYNPPFDFLPWLVNRWLYSFNHLVFHCYLGWSKIPGLSRSFGEYPWHDLIHPIPSCLKLDRFANQLGTGTVFHGGKAPPSRSVLVGVGVLNLRCAASTEAAPTGTAATAATPEPRQLCDNPAGCQWGDKPQLQPASIRFPGRKCNFEPINSWLWLWLLLLSLLF